MSFSWKRGLLHGAAAAGLLIVAGAALSAAHVVADPERFGEGMARFVIFAFAGGVGVSYLFQTGRRTAAWAAIGAVVALAGLLVAVVLGLRAGKPARLTEAERRPMVVEARGAERWLVQPALGVGVLHPGEGFKDAPAALLQSAFPADLDAQAHGWFDAERGRMLLVLVTSMAPGSQDELEKLLAGVDRGLSGPLGGMIGELAVVERSASWQDGRGEVRLHRGNGTANLRVGAWTLGRTFIVVTMTLDGDGLAGVAGSLRRI